MKIRSIATPHFATTEDWTASTGSYEAHSHQADRFTIADSPDGKVATFTVKPADMYPGGERSEVILGNWNDSTKFKIVGAEEAVEYHRMTVKLHSPWVPPNPDAQSNKWGCVWQLHGPNWFAPGSPPMALDAQEVYKLFLFGGSGSGGGYLEFSDPSLAVDTWVAWVIEVKWRFDNTGYVRVWRRNEGVAEFTEVAASYDIPTLAWRVVQSGYPHYIKCGYYRSASVQDNTVSHRKIIRTTKRDLAFA